MIIYDNVTGTALFIQVAHYISHSQCLAFTRLANELCSERLGKVKQNICDIVRFRVVLTCVFDQICVNIRLLGMRVKTNDCTLSKHVYLTKMTVRVLGTLIKKKEVASFLVDKSKLTLRSLGKLDYSKMAVHFLGIYNQTQAAVRFLGLLDQK